MRAIIRLYRDAFGGLSAPTWVLSGVMLINRSGAMVLPFLAIYLTEQIGLSTEEAGLILACYGLGAMTGSYLGGWLTDRVGHFRVQFGSLIVTGLYFLLLSTLTDFYSLAFGVFALSAIADTLRPANGASIGHYARPENITKAFSLNRLAINLGYSIGPAIGGTLAAASFKYLFYADALTCILAGLFFFWYFRRFRASEDAHRAEQKAKNVKRVSVWKDKPFVLFCALNVAFAVVFFQILNTLPLFYRDVYDMPKPQIGGMLAVNGLLIFALEMIVVHLWGHRFKVIHFVIAGTFLNGLSYAMLNMVHSVPWLYAAMFVLSFAEIFAMPFAVSWVSQRAGEAARGSYMGLYTMSYAVAHIIAPFVGTRVIANYGFETLWWGCGALGVATSLGYVLISKSVQAERALD